MKYHLFLLIFTVLGYSQQVKISGSIKDKANRSIEGASVILVDNFDNTISYTYTDTNGLFKLNYNNQKQSKLILSISSFGFEKKRITLDLNSKEFINVLLEEKINNLNEVIIDSEKRVTIDLDTTTIKVAKFGNKTEQTVEDLLKKLPGIEVMNDGTIKAHGKTINKLLIEGEDLFNKNYKILSKNLDANVLDAVQIIDNFEDNPILKKLSNSDKVALNLKLKFNKQNIWFGNVILGAGVITENRWKESLNLGLLRKKIKIFNFTDYNNSGDKATDLLSNSILENEAFGEDKYEKTSSKLYSISSNENTTFSKSQSIFNNSFFNSLSFNKKLNSNFTIRGLVSFANDIQKQESFSETNYNLELNPIFFTEKKSFRATNTLFFGEIELKYINKKNYFNNLIILKNNSSNMVDYLLFNSDKINQLSNNQNQTLYNHFNHSVSISKNSVLNNYFYFGLDKNLENVELKSPFLSLLFSLNQNNEINQISKNKIFYLGAKSKIISKFKKVDNVISLLLEKQIDISSSKFSVDKANISNYENETNFSQNMLVLENVLRYNFNQKLSLSSAINFTNNYFKINVINNLVSVINPNISLSLNKIWKFYIFLFTKK